MSLFYHQLTQIIGRFKYRLNTIYFVAIKQKFPATSPVLFKLQFKMFRILVVLFLTPICLTDEFECNKLHILNTQYCVLEYCKNQENSSTKVDQINSQVEFMEISVCKVDAFPNNLWKTFPNLQTVSLRGVELTGLDSLQITGSQHVKVIKIENSIVTSLNRTVCLNCQKLEILEISNCELKIISTIAFQGLTSLTSLDLRFNDIEVLDKNTFEPLINIKGICLTSNKIKKIKKELFTKNLELINIFLDYNHITEIQEGVIKIFTKLKNFAAMGNELESIENLKIETIDLYNNNLKSFYVEDQNKFIHISHNLIERFSCSENGKLSVDQLAASYNLMNSMECISRMHNLSNLDLEHNKFTNFSAKSFSDLKQLRSLQICYNPLKEFDVAILKPLPIRYLTINNLSSYDTLKTISPTLESIDLDIKEWSCPDVRQVLDEFEAQNITMGSQFRESLTYEC